MTYLTEKQRDVLDFIRRRIAASGVAPTLQETADAFGFSSTASAQKHVGLLERKGYLRREKHQKRGLVLPAAGRPGAAAGSLPLLGVVPAGSPIESIPDEESITVPADMLGEDPGYALRVRGDSMVEEGIQDGDIVIVRRAGTAADIEQPLVGHRVHPLEQREPRGALEVRPAHRVLAGSLSEYWSSTGRPIG